VGPFGRSTRAAMDEASAAVLAILHDTINELRDAAEVAKAGHNLRAQALIGDILGRLGLRYLELSLGRKLSLNVNVRSQDDLFDYRTVPAEVRARLDQALDAVDDFQRARALPARALSSERGEHGA